MQSCTAAMFSRKPKNGRRNSSLTYFTSFVSCARIRRLQSLLRQSDEDIADKPEAILCILGVDCRFDEGHSDLAEYLLFDFFEGRGGIEDEEAFEDLVILVSRSSVEVYCNPINYPFLLPYVAHWPGLRLHCLNTSQYEEDEDLAENFKITSFIDMCKGYKSIGMPFGTRGRPQPFDPFLIEKWPIIQASALDDFGGGGFFTLKHKVIDINKTFWKLCDEIDPCTLEVHLSKKQPLFEKQWNNMLININMAFSSGRMGSLSEDVVAEPLESFYSYGNLLSRSPRDSEARKPYVLFGQNSLLTRQGPHQSLGSAGIKQTMAKHMVCQAVSSKSPLMCSRTYFFTSGSSTYPLTGGTVPTPKPPKTDIDLLERMYKVVVSSVLASIEMYAKTLSVTKTKAVCLDQLQTGFKEAVIPTGIVYLNSIELVRFSLFGLNTNGELLPLEDDQQLGVPKTISLVLKDIPSIEYPGECVGSIEFSETFIESRVAVKMDESISSVDHSCLILTSAIPRVQTWEMQNSKDQTSSIVTQFTQNPDKPFGDLLVDGVSCSVVGSQELSGTTHGTLYVCEDGLMFVDVNNNLAVFPMSYIEELQLFDQDSTSAVSILCLTYRHSLQPYLPLPYHNADDLLVIAFTPKTKAYRSFYSEVVSRWQKRKTDPVLKLLSEAPENTAQLYKSLQLKYEMDMKTIATVKPMQQAAANIPGFDRFMNHLIVSRAFRDIPISQLELPYALKENPPSKVEGDVTEDMIVVSLLTGQPGSHQEELCSALVSMAKEQNRWMVMKPPIESSQSFSMHAIQESMTAACMAARKQRQNVRAVTGGRKKMRVLLVIPAFTSTVEVVRAIKSHPNPEVAKRLSIGAVTVCVDPHNFYMSHRLTFPMLLDQCAQGWVNNILFTGSTDTQNLDMAFCQDMLRKVNSNVAFILADKGEIRRSTDAELIVSEVAYDGPEMRRARHLLSPGWYESETLPSNPSSFNQVSIEFYQPLDRTKLISKLRYLKQNFRERPLDGNVYHIKARTKFTGSDQQMEVYYTTLSDYLSITEVPEMPIARPPSVGSPRRPTPPGQPTPPGHAQTNGAGDGTVDTFHMVFIGCGLDEGLMREWLRACTRQRPAKKSLKSRSSLTSQEIKKIQADHHLDPLPQGWFYNGSQYVSMMGEKQSIHPDLETFKSAFINDQNENIEAYNKRIDAEPFLDLFERPQPSSSIA